MAFHPFHWFRKHQKVFFAILTIICMVVFVVSFGVGDPFSRMGRDRRPAGKYVATLYGRKVHEGDLETLSVQRALVNDLMVGGSEVRDPLLSPGLVRRAMWQLLGDFQSARANIPGDLDELLKGIYNRIPGVQPQERRIDPLTRYNEVRTDLQRLWERRWGQIEKSDALKAIDQLSTILEIETYLTHPTRKPNDLYFGGTRSTEDLLDFMIWQNQADRLGIALTETEVVKALALDLGGVDVVGGRSFSKSPLMIRFVKEQRRDPGLTDARLLKAVTDEMRVQMARRALLGQEVGFRASRGANTPSVVCSPGVPTPDQFYNFYREKLTSENLAVLDLPVSAFLGEVTTQPRVNDLDYLFREYKSKEPDPRLPTPGFKSPQKPAFAFFKVREDMPGIQERARALILTQSLQQIVYPMSVSPMRIPPIWPMSLQAEYLSYENSQKNLRYGDPGVAFIRDSHLVRPAPIGAAVNLATAAQGMPSPAGLGGMLSIPWAMVGPVALEQEAERERTEKPYFTAASLVGLGAVPGLGVVPSGLFTTAGALTKTKIEPVPAAVLTARQAGPILLQEESNREAFRILFTNFMSFPQRDSEFRAQLTKLKDAKEKETYIQETAKKFGLEIQSLKQPEDRYALETSKELEPIKNAYTSMEPSGRWSDFVAGRLLRAGLYDPQMLDELPAHAKPRERPTYYIIWKTEDIKAREPDSMEEVRSQVEQAWRFLKARELARTKARQLEKELKQRQEKVGDVDLTQFLNEQQLGAGKSARVFDLDRVARLVAIPNVAGGQTMAYKDYTPPRDKIEYPPVKRDPVTGAVEIDPTTGQEKSDFAARVLDTLKKKGDSMVLADRPEKHFYVILATSRREPGEKSMLETYAEMSRNPFWSQYALPTSVEDYQKRVLAELRTAAAGAKNVNDQGQIIIPADVRKTFDVVSEGGE